MEQGRADDLLDHFLVAMDKLNLARVIQVSMDRPNVNWTFHDKQQKKLRLEFNCWMLGTGTIGTVSAQPWKFAATSTYST